MDAPREFDHSVRQPAFGCSVPRPESAQRTTQWGGAKVTISRGIRPDLHTRPYRNAFCGATSSSKPERVAMLCLYLPIFLLDAMIDMIEMYRDNLSVWQAPIGEPTIEA